MEQAPSLFRESEAWFAKLEALALKSVPLNVQGQELAEHMRIGVKGALTTPKERAHTAEVKEKPSLGWLDDEEGDVGSEELAEAMRRLRA